MVGLGENVLKNLLEYSRKQVIILHYISLKPLVDAHTENYILSVWPQSTDISWPGRPWVVKFISLSTSYIKTVTLGWRFKEWWACEGAVEVLLWSMSWLIQTVNSTTLCQSATAILVPMSCTVEVTARSHDTAQTLSSSGSLLSGSCKCFMSSFIPKWVSRLV